MAVLRLFKNEAFEPEAISTMTDAYAEVCRVLGVSDRRESHVVAKTVIEFAQRGARDPVQLRDCVLQALRNKREIGAGENGKRETLGQNSGAKADQGCAARQFGP